MVGREEGYTPTEGRRLMVEVGMRTWGRAWPTMEQSLGGNPWAAMPSLHFATSVMAAICCPRAAGQGRRRVSYAATLGFGLVYLGEHTSST